MKQLFAKLLTILTLGLIKGKTAKELGRAGVDEAAAKQIEAVVEDVVDDVAEVVAGAAVDAASKLRK